jgi:hypothetical protein
MTCEKCPRIPQVLLGMGLGGGDAVKGFVEEGDDALLFGERRDGNGISLDKFLGNALVTDSAGHSRGTLQPERFTAKKVIEPFLIQGSIWAKNDVLTRTESDGVYEVGSYAEFAVFEAWGDFCKENIAVSKVGVTPGYL